MLFYFIIFGLSVSLFYLADNKKFYIGEHRAKFVSLLCVALAIFIPCFIAGVRDSTIGYDMQLYGDSQFEYAGKFDSYFDYINTYVNLEKLYALVAYFCAHYGNRYIYYFTLQLLTILPFYLLLKEECNKKVWIGMFAYFMWIYPFSLNIMRQSIAIAIVCWGYRYIKRHQFFRYLITILVAFGFHTTAILGICPYIINLLVVDTKNGNSSVIRKFFGKFSNLNKTLIILGSCAAVMFGGQVITYLSAATGRYNRFFLDMAEASGFNFSNIVNLFIMIVVLICLYQVSINDKSKEINFLILIIGVGAIIYQLKAISSQMYRLSMYFSCYLIWVFPVLLSNSRLNRQKRELYSAIFVLCMIFNFWYYIIFRSWHSVYPYTSQFLGIG